MRRQGRLILAGLAGIGLALGATARAVAAHHAFAAEFEASKPITLKGTLTRMEWTNPHVWIYFDAKKPDGTVEPWACEAGSPNTLFRRGFTKKSVLPGAEIIMDGYRAKDASKRASCRDITFADGRKMFLGSSGTGAPYELTPDQDRVPPTK
jgi:hypothetical protein